MSTPSVVRIYAQPVLAKPAARLAPAITLAVRPETTLTPETPATQVVQDTWFGLSAATGQVRLRPGEVLGVKFADPFDPVAALVAATIGQYLGRHMEPLEVALSMPDSPPDAGYYVGDPTFSAALRRHVIDKAPLRLEGRHSQLLNLVNALLPAAASVKEEEPVLLGKSTMPTPVAMAAGWVMGSLFPKNAMQLRHGEETITCGAALVLAPTRQPARPKIVTA